MSSRRIGKKVRSLLGDSYSRPGPAVLRHQPTSKTTQTRARLSRPPRLDLVESEMPTPSLTSPSTSDSASLFSLDTRPSNPPQAGFVRSRFQHHQQKASITSVVQIHPTIREETSLSNLRKASGVADGQDRSSLELPADAWELQDDMGGRAPWLAQCNRSFRSQPVALDGEQWWPGQC